MPRPPSRVTCLALPPLGFQALTLQKPVRSSIDATPRAASAPPPLPLVRAAPPPPELMRARVPPAAPGPTPPLLLLAVGRGPVCGKGEETSESRPSLGMQLRRPTTQPQAARPHNPCIEPGAAAPCPNQPCPLLAPHRPPSSVSRHAHSRAAPTSAVEELAHAGARAPALLQEGAQARHQRLRASGHLAVQPQQAGGLRRRAWRVVSACTPCLACLRLAGRRASTIGHVVQPGQGVQPAKVMGGRVTRTPRSFRLDGRAHPRSHIPPAATHARAGRPPAACSAPPGSRPPRWSQRCACAACPRSPGLRGTTMRQSLQYGRARAHEAGVRTEAGAHAPPAERQR